jgi:23S rRNA (cytosine1962-C5)-methyltransferase
MPAKITIKPNREKPIVKQHPWIFSGAIDGVSGNPSPGDIVDVVGRTGKFLARGYWNPKSQIQVRLLTWQDETIDEIWWRQKIQRAVDARNPHKERACRLINAENDFLPGLIVDLYDEYAVLQALTLFIDQQKQAIANILADLLRVKGIYERSDVDVRQKEGLKQSTGLLFGEEPAPLVRFSEENVWMQADLRNGHKTGFYLDQHPNRVLLAKLIAAQLPYQTARVLNLFSYTGGFGLHALFAEAEHVTNVDASRDALELGEQNVALNGFDASRAEHIQADVFEYLRDAAVQREQFDVIVCDPPKFAHSAQQVERAARGYKDLNLNSFKLVKPGGYLMTFSCSGSVSADLFQKIVFGALADSGRQAQILRHLGPGEDHPVALTFPEGAYLKGLLLRVY